MIQFVNMKEFFLNIFQSLFSQVDIVNQKDRDAFLELMAYLGIVSGIALGIYDIVFQYPAYGLAPFTYAVITLFSFMHYKFTSKDQPFVFIQLLSISVFPFIGQILHGGYVLSGSAIIWSLIAPVCAVLFFGPARATLWFLGYVLLIITAGFSDFYASHLAIVAKLKSSPWFFSAHLLGISLVIFILILFFVYKLREEQKRSEQLLLNILPKSIARRLKDGETHIADEFTHATILFADIAGFTEMSGQMKAEDMVTLLNKVFSAFDILADKYKLEKIKTIGDAYMIVGGIPTKSDTHVIDTLNVALEMIQVLEEINNELGSSLKIRIGINCGSVVAGVIGIKKFIYDLWGDAVNVASRMESTGVIGKIQTTETVYMQAKEQFNFSQRGSIEVKGKGKMITYFLENQKSSDG